MPIQILPQQEGLAEKLGRGLGTGLGSGLQALAEQKMKTMQLEQQAPALAQLLDITPQNAFNLLQQPQAIQGAYAKEIAAAPRRQAEAQAYEDLYRETVGDAREQAGTSETPVPGSAVQIGIGSNISRDIMKERIKNIREVEKRIDKLSENKQAWLKPHADSFKEATFLKDSYATMANAAASGNLISGPTKRAANALNWGDFATNAPSQIYDKAANDVKLRLLKVALPAGTRITNMLEQMAGRTVPGRELDENAIRALSEAGKRLMEAETNEFNIANELVPRDQRERLPFDIDVQLTNKSLEKNKQLSDEIEFILERALQNKPYIDPSVGLISFNSLDEVKEIPENKLIYDSLTGISYTPEEYKRKFGGR